MNKDHHRESAKIYIFPVGRHVRPSGAVQLGTMDKEAFASFVDTDSWYHQDAIDAHSDIVQKQ